MASLPLLLALLTAAPPLTTLSEQSGWRRTGRYDEVLRLCDAFPQAYPGKARCERFGVTPEGRPMVALVVSSDGVLEPKAAQAKGRPVVLFQGGIHAGEIDGKDAGFWLLRDVLDGKALPGVLGKVTAVFVPVFNIDGHERFGPNNRPNQRGPEQMGFRTTAQGFNLNRDYVKAEAPEMAAMLGLLGRWDPLIYVDLHVTDGAKFRHDVAVMAQPLHSGAPELRPLALEASDAVLSELTAQGHLPLPFYPSFRKEDDPMSGFAAGVAPPRFSQAYWAARNRIGVLVETHAWFDYPHRVKTTRNVVQAWLRRAAEDGPALLEAARAADARDRRAGATEVVLAIDTTEKSRPIPFQGFAYVVEPSEISGTTWTRYDETRPELWTLPLFDELKVTLTGRSPAGGYVVPAAHAAWVGQKLKLHGFEFEVLEKDRPAAEVEAFRATEVKPARARSYEGRVPLSIQGAWAKEKRDVPRGSLYVPANQRGRELLVHLLDPVSP
ncbi:MAG TPA: M14 family zinc carboxypeptidase, partial [Longimicrobium sp.]|nr:M14 family zinc carboxypeptidase [Longimicrobium sp.]